VPVNNTPATFIWLALDDTFTYALKYYGIWKYSNSSHSYQPYLINTIFSFYTGSSIISSSNRVIAINKNMSSCVFLAFFDNNKTLIYASNFSFFGYSSQPKSSISPNLSKIIIYGPVLTGVVTSLRIDAFSIDYIIKTRSKINFSPNFIMDPLLTLILIQ